MRKASKILCLIGGILAIVLAVVWLIMAVVYFIYGAAAAAIAAGNVGGDLPQSIKDFLIKFIEQHPEYTSWDAIASALFAKAILFVVMFLFSIPCAVISFIVSKKEKTGLPLPIVLAVLSWAGNVVSFVGAVLAIVNWAVVERKEK